MKSLRNRYANIYLKLLICDEACISQNHFMVIINKIILIYINRVSLNHIILNTLLNFFGPQGKCGRPIFRFYSNGYKSVPLNPNTFVQRVGKEPVSLFIFRYLPTYITNRKLVPLLFLEKYCNIALPHVTCRVGFSKMLAKRGKG